MEVFSEGQCNGHVHIRSADPNAIRNYMLVEQARKERENAGSANLARIPTHDRWVDVDIRMKEPNDLWIDEWTAGERKATLRATWPKTFSPELTAGKSVWFLSTLPTQVQAETGLHAGRRNDSVLPLATQVRDKLPSLTSMGGERSLDK